MAWQVRKADPVTDTFAIRGLELPLSPKNVKQIGGLHGDHGNHWDVHQSTYALMIRHFHPNGWVGFPQ